MAVSAVIIIGRTRLLGPLHDGLAQRQRPGARSWLKYETSSRPSMMATPKMRDEADRRRDAEVRAGQLERPDAAQRQGDHVRQHQQRVEHRAERQVEQHEESAPATAGTMTSKPGFGLFHLLELAAPVGAVRGLNEGSRLSPGPRRRRRPGRGRGR